MNLICTAFVESVVCGIPTNKMVYTFPCSTAMVRLALIDSSFTCTETFPGVIALKFETEANGALFLNTSVPLEETVTNGCFVESGMAVT